MEPEVAKSYLMSKYDQWDESQDIGTPYSYHVSKGFTKLPVIYKQWETGGVSGGSCWDSSDPQPYSGESEPDFTILNDFLTSYKPTLTFLQFQEIEKMIQTDDHTEYEYYGNQTSYCIKYIVLDDLVTYLDSL